MATKTSTNNTDTAIPTADEAAAKVTQLTEKTTKKLTEYAEQAAAEQKKAALAAIDSYENSVLEHRRLLREVRRRGQGRLAQGHRRPAGRRHP